MILGLTGKTGAGKTTISNELRDFGFYIMDVDLIAKFVMDESDECKEKLKEEFGKETIFSDGSINRKILAEYAFENRNTLYKLSKISHPYILAEVKKRVTNIKKLNKNIVIDAAALFESGMNSLCDYVICVTAPKFLRVDRIVKRDKISNSMALKRINSQQDDDFYESKSDFILKCCDMNIVNKEIERIISKIGGLDIKYEN